jgi:isopentenyl-diphosphate delta-isomerase
VECIDVKLGLARFLSMIPEMALDAGRLYSPLALWTLDRLQLLSAYQVAHTLRRHAEFNGCLTDPYATIHRHSFAKSGRSRPPNSSDPADSLMELTQSFAKCARRVRSGGGLAVTLILHRIATRHAVSAPTRTSLIDRVDDRDHPIGVVQRGDVLRLGANFRTVHVFVLHGDLILLQKLAPTRERHPERWGSSVAAYLHAGEDYEQAAHRRVWEELGLEGQLEQVGKTSMEDESSLKFVELYTFTDGQPAIREPDHIEDLRYWHRGDLDPVVTESPELFTPTFLHVYRYFEQRLTTANN